MLLIIVMGLLAAMIPLYLLLKLCARTVYDPLICAPVQSPPYPSGSRVLILEKSNDGWWRGHLNGLVGWFPSNYTTEEPPDEEHTYTVAENVLDVVVALYSFTAQNEHELSFSKGDRMEVLDRPPSDPEWYRARNTQREVSLGVKCGGADPTAF